MTHNNFVSMLTALAAFAVVAAITFNGHVLSRGLPPIVLAGER
jgi:hypothetical protein